MLLTQELALVALAFDDFSSLVDCYLCTVAKVAQVAQSSDQQRFLLWLKHTRELTCQQRDFIAYQQAEYSCINRARARRAAHLAFQQLRCRPTPEAGAAEAALWHVNPVRAWSRLAMPEPDGRELFPCDVVFFPVGERVENTRVSRRQRRWLGKLPSTWAGTFEAWMAKTACRRPEQLQASLESWEAVGLVAVEEVGVRRLNGKSSEAGVTTRTGLR